MKKKNVYKLSQEATLHSHLTRFRRMLKKALQSAPPPMDFNEEEWFWSCVEVASFMNCSVRTVRRLRKRGKLPCIQHKNVCLFRIAEVLKSIADDDRLSRLFIRKPLPKRRPKPLTARYHSFLRKGWLWIVVRFLGKDTTIVVKQKHWNSDERIAHLVKEVISFRLSSKTSKSAGHEKN